MGGIGQPAENGAKIVTSLSPRISKTSDVLFIFVLFFFVFAKLESCLHVLVIFSPSRLTVWCVARRDRASAVNVADGRRSVTDNTQNHGAAEGRKEKNNELS